MENTLLYQILKQPFQTLVLTGDTKSILSSLKTFFENEEGIDIESHGDTIVHIVDSLSVDFAREIKGWTEGMPQYRPSKVLILAPTIFPHVSQNTLLKTFEEPSGNTQIVLVVKDSSMLLPTILSRAVVYTIASEQNKYDESLLRLAPYERLSHDDAITMLKTGLQKPSKEKVLAFFENIAGAVLQSTYGDKERREAIQVLTTVTPYIHNQGASIKMLVEYTCLQLPSLKLDK